MTRRTDAIDPGRVETFFVPQ